MAPIMQYATTALSFLAVTALAAPAVDSSQPTVTMPCGVVVGTATALANQPSATGLCNAYLGVPYADKPERFAAPAPVKHWSGKKHAQNLAPSCLQQFGAGSVGEKTKEYFNNPGGPPPAESEDCLYLNVYAPQNASTKNKKPVLFFIHGGNLQFGSGSNAMYDGGSLAVNNDVIVVTFNYRTNIFGFSHSPDIPHGQQNSGFLDQRFALQWVQNNIAHFGGDPSRVTIFGQNAGAYSVKQLLANPPSTKQYRAAIIESSLLLNYGNGDYNYKLVEQHFGCSGAASPLACMRKVPASDMLNFINDNSLNFPPVDGDGTHSQNCLPSIQSGQFSNVPIFIGTNKDEATIFLDIAGLDHGTDYVEDVQLMTGFNVSSTRSSCESAYPPSIANDPTALANRVITDFLFTCTTSLLSKAIVGAGRQPVWRYVYEPSFPDTALFPNSGAYHASEIPEVFGTYPLSDGLGSATHDQIALSSFMQSIWAGFAKNPTGSVNWPKLGSDASYLCLFGDKHNPSGESAAPTSSLDNVCSIYNDLLEQFNIGY